MAPVLSRRMLLVGASVAAAAMSPRFAFAAQKTLADIKASGVIKIGVEGTFPPFSFREGGKLIGYDVDLADLMFKELGVKPEFLDTQWSGVVLALLSGRFDIIMSSLSYTKERMEKVAFSIPYADSSLALLIPAAQVGKIKSFEDMSGKTIGLKAGTPEETAVPTFDAKAKAAHGGKGFAAVKTFDSDPIAILALGQGNVDAVISNMTNLGQVLKQQPGKFALVQNVAGASLAGIGIRKEDTELKSYIDKQLAALTASGKLAELQEKWFGVKFDMPGQVPAL
jgi:polar amino acid transport system substrate-binding protein